MATLSLFYGILITMRPEEGERHKKSRICMLGTQAVRRLLTSQRESGLPERWMATTRPR